MGLCDPMVLPSSLCQANPFGLTNYTREIYLTVALDLQVYVIIISQWVYHPVDLSALPTIGVIRALVTTTTFEATLTWWPQLPF